MMRAMAKCPLIPYRAFIHTNMAPYYGLTHNNRSSISGWAAFATLGSLVPRYHHLCLRTVCVSRRSEGLQVRCSIF